MAFVIQHRYSPFLGVSGIVGTGVRRLRNQCPAKIGTGVRLKSEWVSGRRRNTHIGCEKGEKGCTRTIWGCDKWPVITRGCCEKHERVHMQQLIDTGSTFCQEKMIGTNKCCVGEGRCSNVSDYPGKTQAELECPAHEVSFKCCSALFNGGQPMTEQEACDVWACMFASKGQGTWFRCAWARSAVLPPQPANCDLPTQPQSFTSVGVQ